VRYNQCISNGHPPILLTFPVASNVKSNPPSVISIKCCVIVFPSGKVFGLINSVAPNFFAHSSLLGLVSIATIREALTCRAPFITPRPTQPHPKTATVEPADRRKGKNKRERKFLERYMGEADVRTPGSFVTAPQAVVIPHPRRHTLSRGASPLILTTDTSARTVYWENVDVPICKPKISTTVKTTTL
jgi:hypothetical protein